MPADYFECREIKDFSDLLDAGLELSDEAIRQKTRWIYRGERQLFPYLMTSLERACLELYDEFPADNMRNLERKIVREFKRRLHHYTNDMPHKDDLYEWLALMQHYEAPTRLLDWTYSFFVAVYFAVEYAEADKPCGVWALRMNSFDPNDRSADQVLREVKRSACRIYKRRFLKIPAIQDRPWLNQLAILNYLFHHPKPLVLAVNPFRLNERLTVQQGVFLTPGDISKPFHANLMEHPNLPEKLIRFRIQMNDENQREFLRQLHNMNISRASLFPGLEGFARSLRTRLAIPETMSHHEGGTHS